MNASQFIEVLKNLVSEHGDLPILNEREQFANPPEFNYRGLCILVTFDESC